LRDLGHPIADRGVQDFSVSLLAEDFALINVHSELRGETKAAVMFSINFAYNRIFHFRPYGPFPKSRSLELAAQN
jgi:hypothetical protein